MLVEHVVCAFCGCTCDDLAITVDDNQVTGIKGACALGKAWVQGHAAHSDEPAARIGGQPVPLAEGVAEAARILTSARLPLIYGLSSTCCEAQRQAILLAELTGACIDCCTSVCHGPSGMALQGVGEPTSTLGEVKNRADFELYWGSNPAASHPRHFTRYALMPKGKFRPRGRKERTIVVIDVRPTPSVKAADLFLQIKPGGDFELCWALRALLKGVEPDRSVEQKTGLTLEQIRDLAERMRKCAFGVLFVGQGLTQSRGKHMNTSAAFMLVRDLNAFTKFVAIPMRGHGNVTGIDAVLSWQTGYPFGVNFSRGYPRFNPGEYTAVDLLSRKDADAALVIASDPVANLPGTAARRLAEIPTICVDTHPSETSRVARVAFTTGTVGIHAEGTMYRMDNVPLHLRSFLSSPYPSDETLLGSLVTAVKAHQAGT
jgi:formylmethanofuran dehydrogenase subunit B